MARFIKSNKENIGISPDALVFRGKKRTDNVRLRIIDYDAENLNEVELKNIQEASAYNHPKTTTWFNIDGLHDEGIMLEISKIFEVDTLILSDVLNTHARPKMQDYDNSIFISLKMLKYDEDNNRIHAENLVLIIKDNVLLTFQERQGDVFEPVRERIRKNRKRIRTSGTDYLAFALLDIVIENYIYIISRIGEKIESIEDKLIGANENSIIHEINTYKREIQYLRKLIKPSQDLLINLVKLDSELLKENTYVHFKELQDNINHAIESLDSYREILSDQLNIFHTNVSDKLNDIMKFLTIFSVIFIPLTFIAGIYGTNFDNVPELHYKYSYFIMWGVMVFITTGMIIYFKRKKWF